MPQRNRHKSRSQSYEPADLSAASAEAAVQEEVHSHTDEIPEMGMPGKPAREVRLVAPPAPVRKVSVDAPANK